MAFLNKLSTTVIMACSLSFSQPVYAGYQDFVRGKTLEQVRAEEHAKEKAANPNPAPAAPQAPVNVQYVPAVKPQPQHPPTGEARSHKLPDEVKAQRQEAREKWKQYVANLPAKERRAYENRIAESNPQAQQARLERMKNRKSPNSVLSLSDADREQLKRYLGHEKDLEFKDLSKDVRQFVRRRYRNDRRVPPPGLDLVDFNKPIPAEVYWTGVRPQAAEEVRVFMQSGAKDPATLSPEARSAYERALSIQDFIKNRNNPKPIIDKIPDNEYREQQMRLRNERIQAELSKKGEKPVVTPETDVTPSERSRPKTVIPVTTEMYNNMLAKQKQ